MVKIFRQYGEVVLTVGSGYRAKNHSIYMASDLATSVSMLPSVSTADGIEDSFPFFCWHDIQCINMDQIRHIYNSGHTLSSKENKQVNINTFLPTNGILLICFLTEVR